MILDQHLSLDDIEALVAFTQGCEEMELPPATVAKLLEMIALQDAALKEMSKCELCPSHNAIVEETLRRRAEIERSL